MNMHTTQKLQRRFGRTLKVALVLLLIVAMTVGLFLLASVLFEFDPDGQKVRGWLNANRYGLFTWRLTLYALIGWGWFFVVRPQATVKMPGISIQRLEWITVGFIVILELAAWRSVIA
ncbi:hypothetical protein J1782_08395 [Rahnella sp. BCC 1045]|uniref:hypothetical protein n=1 Tax=Rahnella sp. BCC 1045 TaxID=2816251 RepID=UPI001C2700AA|nr:hypothetical protein [Rahnella sp. BCC 1045]MBU9819905.1 hypothetical protein [Rahnella sp. BCC 1045]